MTDVSFAKYSIEEKAAFGKHQKKDYIRIGPPNFFTLEESIKVLDISLVVSSSISIAIIPKCLLRNLMVKINI